MVALNFNAHAFAFQSGLDTIEQGYEAAVNGITLEINRKKAAFYDYCRYIENGGAPTEERDDDGVLIWSPDELLQGTIFVAEAAIMRSDAHTSELQSLMRILYAVFCLTKKQKYTYNPSQLKTLK